MYLVKRKSQTGYTILEPETHFRGHPVNNSLLWMKNLSQERLGELSKEHI